MTNNASGGEPGAFLRALTLVSGCETPTPGVGRLCQDRADRREERREFGRDQSRQPEYVASLLVPPPERPQIQPLHLPPLCPTSERSSRLDAARPGRPGLITIPPAPPATVSGWLGSLGDFVNQIDGLSLAPAWLL